MEHDRHWKKPSWKVKDCAEYLSVSEKQIRRQMKSHGLPYVRIGTSVRFIPAEVEAWLENRKIGVQKNVTYHWSGWDL